MPQTAFRSGQSPTLSACSYIPFYEKTFYWDTYGSFFLHKKTHSWNSSHRLLYYAIIVHPPSRQVGSCFMLNCLPLPQRAVAVAVQKDITHFRTGPNIKSPPFAQPPKILPVFPTFVWMLHDSQESGQRAYACRNPYFVMLTWPFPLPVEHVGLVYPFFLGVITAALGLRDEAVFR